MAARVLRKQEVADAVKAYCEMHPEMAYSSNEHGFTLLPGEILSTGSVLPDTACFEEAGTSFLMPIFSAWT